VNAKALAEEEAAARAAMPESVASPVKGRKGRAPPAKGAKPAAKKVSLWSIVLSFFVDFVL
jgi:hypothetical protein